MFSLAAFIIMRIITIFIDNRMIVAYNLLLRIIPNKEDE